LGPSGCGKTTFLNLLVALDQPDSGEISLYGQYLSEFSEEKIDSFRNHSVGFIFQTHNLINHLTILQNIELSMTLGGVWRRKRRKRAK
jgi:putative ABC transport system permease protein